MTDENESFVSFNADGINSKIVINTPFGASVKTNATKIHMQNVEENSIGGEIVHHAQQKLHQIGGSQIAKDGGKITNKVESGLLLQEDPAHLAENKGEIINEVKKN